MDKISEHINFSNHKIHSYDRMIKIILNLGSKRCKNNNNLTFQLTRLQDSLLMSIVETPEKDLSNPDCKSDIRKERTYSVMSSPTLFYSSIREIYDRVNFLKTKSHVEVISSRD